MSEAVGRMAETLLRDYRPATGAAKAGRDLSRFPRRERPRPRRRHSRVQPDGRPFAAIVDHMRAELCRHSADTRCAGTNRASRRRRRLDPRGRVRLPGVKISPRGADRALRLRPIIATQRASDHEPRANAPLAPISTQTPTRHSCGAPWRSASRTCGRRHLARARGLPLIDLRASANGRLANLPHVDANGAAAWVPPLLLPRAPTATA